MSLEPTTLGFSIFNPGDIPLIQRKNYDLELLQKHLSTQNKLLYLYAVFGHPKTSKIRNSCLVCLLNDTLSLFLQDTAGLGPCKTEDEGRGKEPPQNFPLVPEMCTETVYRVMRGINGCSWFLDPNKQHNSACRVHP